jgi:hypothetical protein
MVLPDVISAILAQALGPIPRHVLTGASARFFPEGFGLTPEEMGSAHGSIPAAASAGDIHFEAAVIH